MKKKYLCYSDTHFNFTFPWTRYDFINKIKEENPAGLILSGDISCGLTIHDMLVFLAKKLEYIPIYYVLGNHDYYSTSIGSITNSLQNLHVKYPNLLWLTKQDIIPLNDKVALIGDDGWYDVRLGNPIYLHYNLDWIMISEFRKLSSFEEKIQYGRRLAEESTERLKIKLERALREYQTVYIITHMPPYEEACRGKGTDTEEFWLSYNVNFTMGKMIENVMNNRDTQNVVVIAGHSHVPAIVQVAHNIECLVQSGKYYGSPIAHNCLFI